MNGIQLRIFAGRGRTKERLAGHLPRISPGYCTVVTYAQFLDMAPSAIFNGIEEPCPATYKRPKAIIFDCFVFPSKPCPYCPPQNSRHYHRSSIIHRHRHHHHHHHHRHHRERDNSCNEIRLNWNTLMLFSEYTTCGSSIYMYWAYHQYYDQKESDIISKKKKKKKKKKSCPNDCRLCLKAFVPQSREQILPPGTLPVFNWLLKPGL